MGSVLDNRYPANRSEELSVGRSLRRSIPAIAVAAIRLVRIRAGVVRSSSRVCVVVCLTTATMHVIGVVAVGWACVLTLHSAVAHGASQRDLPLCWVGRRALST